jgi:hypothetical protein
MLPWAKVTIPPQHGAWAFLVLPLTVGGTVAGAWSNSATLFALAWIAAFPVSYYAGRALDVRRRRGRWSNLARREARRAAPWAALVAAFGIPLAVTRPWTITVALTAAILGVCSLGVSVRFGERSVANNLVLVLQAVIALPVSAALALDTSGCPTLPRNWPEATAVVALFLFGSVLHVKARLREANNPRFRTASIAYHSVVAVAAAFLAPVWLWAALPALVRAVAVPRTIRPAVLGAVEVIATAAVIAVAFVRW